VFRRRNFFQNRAIRGENVRDIVWLDPAGTQMSDEQWRDGFARSLAVFLSGRGLDEQDERGRTVVDTDFLVLVNAHYEAVEFTLPAQPEDARWRLRVDTTSATFEMEERVFAPGDTYALQGRALALFDAL
jgi:glycogen operon protein